MAAIDPDSTTKVPAEQAVAAAANGAPQRRRERPAPVTAVPDQPTPTPAADPAPPLDTTQLAKVLKALGYANDKGPDLVDPADDEGTMFEFVASGVVRIPAPLAADTADRPRYYRLRPPLFGEHKTIRGALADALEAIDEATLVVVEGNVERNAQRADARQVDEPERSRRMLDIKKAQRRADDGMEAATADAMRPWWDLVFGTLAIDGTPDEFGPWLVDHQLAAEMVNHWRSSPRRPGR